MTGLLLKKYHVAVFDEDEGFVRRTIDTLKRWYKNKIVIKSYTNSHEMFEALNINSAKNSPFDLAVFNSDEVAEKLVVKQIYPDLPVVLCKDEHMLKRESSKILL